MVRETTPAAAAADACMTSPTCLGQQMGVLPPLLLEGLILGILVVLTLFRRRLSSNDQYREMNQLEEDDVDDIFSSSSPPMFLTAADFAAAANASTTPGDNVKCTVGAITNDANDAKAMASLPQDAADGNTDSILASAVSPPKCVPGLGILKRPSFSRFYTFATEMGNASVESLSDSFKDSISEGLEGLGTFGGELAQLDYGRFVDSTVQGTEDFFSKSEGYGRESAASRGTSSCVLISGHHSAGRDRLSRLLPELLLHVVSYLHHREVGPLSSSSRTMAKDAKSDFLWEQLWKEAYGPMWQSEAICRLRNKRSISWDPFARTGEHGQVTRVAPAQGWFVFFLEFEACWLDWLLAGFCTRDMCVIGLGGSVYDITTFLPQHPGSLETLAEACGGDGTERFADIGHSSDAVELLKKHLVCSMPERLTCGQYQEATKINRHRGSRRGHATQFQSGMKREQQLAERIECRSNIHRAGEAKAAAAAASAAAITTASSSTAPTHLDANERENARDALLRSLQISPLVSPSSYFDCPIGEPHFGRARACYDPVEQQWSVWWTCCGRSVRWSGE